MYTTPSLLALAATISSVSAHVSLWDKGLFGLNWPNQADDTQNINWNNNEPVNPLRESDGFSTDQWFGHGLKGFPPKSGDFLVLPAGGRYTGDVACNRAGSRLRNPIITDPLPQYACDGGQGVGALHVMNTYGQAPDNSKFGGTALAIAYTSDVNSLQPNDMTVISVNQNSVWEREISYDIPAGLPPCPEGGCLCTWNWIHQAGSTEGYPFEIYNNLYRCQVTGSTNSGNVVQRGQVPRECGSNSANCVKGPKTPMYIWQAQGNNLPRQTTPPLYRSNWGFNNGAQNDIFAAGSSPAPTTYLDNAYATGTATTRTSPAATATALPSGWTALGCMIDDPNKRALDGGSTSPSDMTIESCTASCASRGFSYAGVEYGQECWCGNKANLNSAPESECNVRCAGDQWSFCGGGYRIQIYKAAGASTTTAAPTVTAAPTPFPANSLPSGWTALGCHVDSGSSRALNGGATNPDKLTIPDCIASCSAKGMPYAGVEYGQECWCGSTANLVPASDGCNSRCGGDSGTICGGSYRINIFKNEAQAGSGATSTSSSRTTSTATSTSSSSTSPSASPTTSLPAGWSSLGCTPDNSGSGRVLTGSYSEANNQTPQSCLASCQSKGFTYAGLEYGRQCYCGNSISLAKLGAGGCTMPCSGDKNAMCGGSYRMNLYSRAQSSGSTIPALAAQPATTTTTGGDVEYRTVTVTATVTVNTCESPTPTPTIAKRHLNKKFEGRKYPLPKHMGRD